MATIKILITKQVSIINNIEHGIVPVEIDLTQLSIEQRKELGRMVREYESCDYDYRMPSSFRCEAGQFQLEAAKYLVFLADRKIKVYDELLRVIEDMISRKAKRIREYNKIFECD